MFGGVLLDPWMLDRLFSCEALFRVFLDELADEVLCLLGQTTKRPIFHVECAFLDLLDGLLGVLTGEWHLTRQHHISQYTQTPHVTTC
jgi:hypothetical protein